MFSIAAINDTESKGKWEPLAPTKEAQEFHLSQTYHEGLHKLQTKEYKKATELLESVLKDPIIANAQVDSNVSDCHLLQLRFLALKNLANVYLQQGSAYYESALRCYLQAVEIDTKDSVVWNQLGTLSCSMGSLSISRWAFEQGLLCSPNNWNCMEKLLEVLIAIGDEVACLSVAELILRHWPSHSRALHVKKTIEESEPVAYAPRGIDKLEPKHVRLKFLDKRKATDENLEEDVSSKKLKQGIDLNLAEPSWAALVDAVLDILLPLNGCQSENGAAKSYRSRDVRLILHLPSSSESTTGFEERKRLNLSPIDGNSVFGDCNTDRIGGLKEKSTNVLEFQPQERRSSRLERLRSRKPGKEDLDFDNGKDQAKVVVQYLEPFIAGGSGIKDPGHSGNCSVSCPDQANPWDTEYGDVSRFVKKTTDNYGAFHVAHLILEEAASRGLSYQDALFKFLELEKVTRNWGKDRSTECCLFLAELYYDLGSLSSDVSRLSEFMSDASYHLCKIIESVAMTDESISGLKRFLGTEGISANSSVCQDAPLDGLPLTSNSSFWVRFFWLSGRLSILDGNKEKAHQEFCISSSLLAKKDNLTDSQCVIHLPYCKVVKELTIHRILHEINILKVDYLMEKTLGEMIEKEMYTECMSLLVPLLFATKNVPPDALPLRLADKGGEGITSVELSALDILIKACEKTKPIDNDVYLNCHRRKLQILIAAAGIDEYLASCKSFLSKSGSNPLYASHIDTKESSSKQSWNVLVAEEVKAISQCVSQVKDFIDQSGASDTIPMSSIGDMQCLLLSVMCNIARICFCKKSSDSIQTDQVERSCFIEASIAFCKLQHLNPMISVKTQVDLIVTMHDLLAEYGLCCASEGGEGEEGTFLKFAIKHLLALDMKFKSNFNSLSKEPTQHKEQLCLNSPVKMSLNETKSDTDLEMVHTGIDETSPAGKDASDVIPSKNTSFDNSLDKDSMGLDGSKLGVDGSVGKFKRCGKTSDQFNEVGAELIEDEREELELKIDYALDQCFFCLYGLNIRSDSSYEDDLVVHKNTSPGDYQTKEQCADVFQYILPYAKASSRTGLVKVRRVLRAIRKHFPQPPEDVLAGNAIDKFLDDPHLCEDKLSEEAGSDGFFETITKIILPDVKSLKQQKTSSVGSSEPYLDVYCNLYYFLALSEEMNATDKWPGFVLTKEGEEFVQNNAKLFKYDLLYNPLRFESWQRLGNIYDEEVDLLLNDGSKHINVAGWRKNATLPQRVETSRRRSRRCLLMSLALAKTPAEQSEIHELLALVYYDSLQSVVPFYDQRTVVPLRDAAWMMFCENSMRHFKKAFVHKQDWSHAYYIGKLCEKLGFSYETSLSYYDKSIALNPTAVDPVYRMHASRLKILCTCGKQNLDTLKVLSTYAFSQSRKDAIMTILGNMDSEHSNSPKDGSTQQSTGDKNHEDSLKLEVWNMLYSDCLSALETCIEGELKHFHKARYMLSQGLYGRGESGALERAKEELSFCFKSTRSSFTINMWEIDSMVKKGRRKTPGLSGNKKPLEVNLPESSRKFITCIRKYLLFYLELLEKTGDICTLDRAYISLRADKRFSLCIEDLVPVALGRYVNALVSSLRQAETVGSGGTSNSEHILEKLFVLFIEQGNLWPEICNLPEVKATETSENCLYGYLHQHIISLEKNGKTDTLEAIHEKIRRRFKNPKLSNSNCAKVCRHASIAWCRSLILSLAQITPSQSEITSEIQVLSSSDVSGNSQLLCVDLQTEELWSSAFEDPTQFKNLEAKRKPIFSKIKTLVVKRASDENLEVASALLRSSYNFYRESSCVMPSSGVNLYLVPSWLAKDTEFRPSTDGAEILDLSIPRKLLLWAYTLLHGRYTNISFVVKHCEENAKFKMKKGAGTSFVPSTPSISNISTTHSGCGRDGPGHTGTSDAEAAPVTTLVSGSFSEDPMQFATPPSGVHQRSLLSAPQLQRCNNSVAERSNRTPDSGGSDRS